MKVVAVLIASVCGLAFGGCVVRGPEIGVKSPVEIKSEPAARFCPPGQAKKGNC
ncbi:MAG TPA: hypothetical protein VGU22_10970 [Methylomirabilota bacterium]|jgi:hypothetical protein|nr:hypothetical protein [Methylomirabilota bacterium]